VEGIALEV